MLMLRRNQTIFTREKEKNDFVMEKIFEEIFTERILYKHNAIDFWNTFVEDHFGYLIHQQDEIEYSQVKYDEFVVDHNRVHLLN